MSEYIIRSAINPALILCTDGQFHADIFVGPGNDLGAKIYKTVAGAERYIAKNRPGSAYAERVF